MTDKAYIVANEEQELRVLNEFEKRGYCWINDQGKPISSGVLIARELEDYPLFIGERFETKTIYWQDLSKLVNEEIVYDGRKESKMKISKKIYDALVEWKNNLVSSKRIYADNVAGLYSENVIRRWWRGDGGGTDTNNRLIAIIRWVNGEDVFEVEKPKKWVVRSKKYDNVGDYLYVEIDNHANLEHEVLTFTPENATKFDTKEEAESWANSHQEVIEVEE